MKDFAGKTGNFLLNSFINKSFIYIIIRNISSGIRFSTFRQLDVFDGAGSGDGIDGRVSATSEKMLVIRINLESMMSRYSLNRIVEKATNRSIFSIYTYRSQDRIAVVQWERAGEFRNTTVKYAQQ